MTSDEAMSLHEWQAANFNSDFQPDPPCNARRTYRGWRLSFEYGYHTAAHPDFDVSYEGPEDGWVGSHPTLQGRTEQELRAEIDAWIEDN